MYQARYSSFLNIGNLTNLIKTQITTNQIN